MKHIFGQVIRCQTKVKVSSAEPWRTLDLHTTHRERRRCGRRRRAALIGGRSHRWGSRKSGRGQGADTFRLRVPGSTRTWVEASGRVRARRSDDPLERRLCRGSASFQEYASGCQAPQSGVGDSSPRSCPRGSRPPARSRPPGGWRRPPLPPLTRSLKSTLSLAKMGTGIRHPRRRYTSLPGAGRAWDKACRVQRT